MEFDNIYWLTGLNPRDLSGVNLAAGRPLIGTVRDDAVSIGLQANGRVIDLANGNDTLTLTEAGTPNYVLNLQDVERVDSVGGSETVSLQNAAHALAVDLGAGTDTLNLANGTNVVTAVAVETINGGMGDDNVTFVPEFGVIGQTINLGGGTNVLNLAGPAFFTLSLSGASVVFGRADSDRENVTLLNVQAGTTFDFGTGVDTLALSAARLPGSPPFNTVFVRDVETVSGSAEMDNITILGNAGGVTTVDAGCAGDFLRASDDPEVFVISATSGMDTIFEFDALEDRFEVHDFAFVDIVQNSPGHYTVIFDSASLDPDLSIQLFEVAGPFGRGNFDVLF